MLKKMIILILLSFSFSLYAKKYNYQEIDDFKKYSEMLNTKSLKKEIKKIKLNKSKYEDFKLLILNHNVAMIERRYDATRRFKKIADLMIKKYPKNPLMIGYSANSYIYTARDSHHFTANKRMKLIYKGLYLLDNAIKNKFKFNSFLRYIRGRTCAYLPGYFNRLLTAKKDYKWLIKNYVKNSKTKTIYKTNSYKKYFASFHFMLGNLNDRLMLRKEAKKNWKKVLQIYPNFFNNMQKLVCSVQHKPPYQVSEETKILHNQLFIADMHSDTLLFDRDILKKSDIGHIDIPRMIEGNLNLQVFSACTKSPYSQNINNNYDSDSIISLTVSQNWHKKTENSYLQRAIYMAKKLHVFEKKSKGKFLIIKNKKNLNYLLVAKKKNKKVAAGMLSLEGLAPMENKISNLKKLYKAGFRMMSFVQYLDNKLSGSKHGQYKKGLTALGKKVLETMQKMNIIVDLSHISHDGLKDALKLIKKPFVISHTGIKARSYNNRNLSDEQIKQIAAKGGVIGIGFWRVMVGGNEVEDIVKAMKNVKNLVGVKHIALGSDFDGFIKSPIDSSGMALITEELLKQGFSKNEIKLIMGENFLRILKKILSN